VKHNFAPWFYPFYVSLSANHLWISLPNLQLFATIAQQLAVVGVGVTYHRDLGLSVALQSLVFVAFNKVITAQYFVWYGSLLPLAFFYGEPSLRLCLAWVAGEVRASFLVRFDLVAPIPGCSGLQIHWLFWAYQLELRGHGVFVGVWLASVMFFVAHIAVVLHIIRRYRQHHKSKVE
jgi:GPI mannosyltransferase 1 subunit M